jgi:hypothetical protein
MFCYKWRKPEGLTKTLEHAKILICHFNFLLNKRITLNYENYKQLLNRTGLSPIRTIYCDSWFLVTTICKMHYLNRVSARPNKPKSIRKIKTGVQTEIKLRIHNIISKGTVRYESKMWKANRREQEQIEAAQISFLRQLLDKTRQDGTKKC